MAPRESKKQRILDCAARQGLKEAGERELRAIQAEVRAERPEWPPLSLGYIAQVLRKSGAAVHYQDPFSEPEIPEPYAARLNDVLHFHDLAAAEKSLRSLDEAYRDYQIAADHAGVRLVRKLLLRGKDRAQRLARSSRVSAAKRSEKAEIASWFRVWLESPDLFFDWLEIRKQTDEFRSLFAPAGPAGNEAKISAGEPQT